MRLKSVFRKVAVAAAAMSTMFAMPTVAQADNVNKENVVIFGDSLFSNPTYAQVNSPQSWGLSSEVFHQGKAGAPSPQGCPQGDLKVGSVLKRTYGHNVVDYSCSGARAGGVSIRNNFTSQSTHALRTGALNKNTSHVLVQFGANDTPGILFGAGAEAISNSSLQAKDYYQSMNENISRVKRAAPNAKITVVSYPAITSSSGSFCPMRTDVGMDAFGTGVDMNITSTVHNTEKKINGAMYKVAKRNNVNYFDLSSVTKGNNSCSPNSQRFIAGLFETGMANNISLHYTDKGVHGVANILNNSVL